MTQSRLETRQSHDIVQQMRVAMTAKMTVA